MLQRNRAERRSKNKAQIFFNGIPYLIFAALAAGFLAGVPSAIASSAITQVDRATVTALKRGDPLFAIGAGFIGRTNAASPLNRLPSLEYSGTYILIDDGGGNWRIKFLTSGTLVFARGAYVDVFLVGGGGGGARDDSSGSGGGGGGYTLTFTYQMLSDTSYNITVGAGGAAGGATINPGSQGGTTSAFGSSASGGYGGKVYVDATHKSDGGAGGSGGGGYFQGNGGSDGANGTGSTSGAGGVGQGSTTREFHEASGALYAGGGGSFQGLGGSGGGGNGGTAQYVAGVSGTANTGGGGGGAQGAAPGAGGSGIVVFRNHRAA